MAMRFSKIIRTVTYGIFSVEMRKTQYTDCQTCKVDDSDHHKTIQATQIVLCLGFPYRSVRKISSTDNYFLIAPNVYNINLRSGSIYQHVRKNI